MPITAQLSPAIFIGSLAFHPVANALDWGVEMQTQDITTFDFAANGFTNSTPGMKSLMFSTTHFQDYDAAAVESFVRANYGTQQAATVAYNGLATGNSCAMARGLMGGYRAVNAAVGAVPTNVVELTGSGTVVAEGLVTAANTAFTVTGNTTAVQVGATAAGRSLYAAVHVTATSGTPSCTFQLATSTTSGGSYTNRGSASAAVTGTGWVWLSAPGAITDTWARLALTISGGTPSLTVFAAIGVA